MHPAFSGKTNALNFGQNETFAHALAKFLLCWELKAQGKHFVTEAIFDGNKRRADVLVLDDGEAWEVLQSESKKIFLEKARHYPVECVPFRAGKVIQDFLPCIREAVKADQVEYVMEGKL